MVRHVFTLTALLVACIFTVFAHPVHRRHETEVACALPHVRALSPNGVSVCSPPSTKHLPSTQTLERRVLKTKKTPAQKKASSSRQNATAKKKLAGIKVPNARKKHARARVAKGQPKGPSPMTPKKAAKVAEKKENRKLAKKQKLAAKITKAKQKQEVPPYVIDEKTRAWRKPQATDKDVTKKAWEKKLKAQKEKEERTKAYQGLSQEAKKEEQRKNAAKDEAKRAAHKAVKEKNRENRIKANTQRKNQNRKYANIAKAAYHTAEGLPSRGEIYKSRQGHPYNGKDVRQAVYASEYAKAKGGIGYNAYTGKQAEKVDDKLPKEFQNRPNSDQTQSLPLPGVVPGGLSEFPILHNKQRGHDGRKPAPTEARIITKKNLAGNTVLVGKVGHPAEGHGDPKGHYSF